MLLADRKLPEVPAFFIEGNSMLLSEAKSQVRQILEAWYPADLEESLVGTPEEGASSDVLASDVKGESDWDLADLTRRLDLGSRAKIRGDYGCVHEKCSVVTESVSSSVVGLLS